MFDEPNSMAYGVGLLARTLEGEYGIDAAPLFADIDIDRADLLNPSTRIRNADFRKVWEIARSICDDPGLGVTAGQRTQVRYFGALGYAWLSSATLADAFARLMRFEAIVDTGFTEIEFVKVGDEYRFSESYPNPADYYGKLGTDMRFSSLVTFCRTATDSHLFATKGEFMIARDDPIDIYTPLVSGTVTRHPTHNALYFRASDVERPLPSAQREVAEAASKTAERYIESLDGNAVSTRVREALIRMLPAGKANQEKVASALFCSTSTLQRQLESEGTTYRTISDQTRQELAEAYLGDDAYSLAQVAFLTGFTDQSNFARAFKRWTGFSPKEFQKRVRAEQVAQ